MLAYMVMGGQWGSEGKGLFAGFMAKQRKPDAVVSQFGPNAGHTWFEGDTPIVFKSFPVGSVAESVENIFLGPGSVINPETFERELDFLWPRISDKSIYVHEAAAIVMPGDIAAEQGLGGVSHIASTMQGTSEAMIRKIRRQGNFPAKQALGHLKSRCEVVNHWDYMALMRHKVRFLQIEGSQGMDLSINSGFAYPYTTSRDCTPAQVLADCGVHPADLSGVYACIRTFPIRVGNIIGGNGLMAGNSGPCYPDQRETSWEELKIQKEYTTVTKRVRRVFTFSILQMEKLLNEVRPHGIFLNFANYTDEWMNIKASIDKMAGRNIVHWTGHGPKYTDIIIHEEPGIVPPEYKE